MISRRGFLGGLAALVGGIAALVGGIALDAAIPGNRVYSFPKVISPSRAKAIAIAEIGNGINAARDYYAIEWPVVSRQWEFGTYCPDTLADSYFRGLTPLIL
jgi:hypothetical protein